MSTLVKRAARKSHEQLLREIVRSSGQLEIRRHYFPLNLRSGLRNTRAGCPTDRQTARESIGKAATHALFASARLRRSSEALRRQLAAMLRSILTLAAACAAIAPTAASPTPILSKRTSPTEPPPVIDLGYSRIQGYLNSNNSQYYWKGVRFASADRFQAPRTPNAHAAVMNASEYGPVCWQAGFDGQVTLEGQGPIVNFPAYTIQSEDCLVLDINAPAGACEGSNLPVMVWIHGGGGFAFSFETSF